MEPDRRIFVLESTLTVACGYNVCHARPGLGGELDEADHRGSTNNGLWHLFWTSGEVFFWTSDMNRERDGPIVNLCSSVLSVNSTCDRPESAYGFYIAYSIRLKTFIERGAMRSLAASRQVYTLVMRPNSGARDRLRSRLRLCERKFPVLQPVYFK